MSKSAKKIIRDALVTLLETQSFDKVTVTDIVTEAKINRSTYYYHYYEIEEILEEIKSECINELAESLKSAYENMSVFEINDEVLPSSYNLFNHVYDKRRYYKSLLSSDLAYSFQNEFIDVITELLHFDFQPVDSLEPSHNPFYSSFYAYGIFSIINTWADSNFSYTPGFMAEQLTEILYNRIERVRANYQNTNVDK